jgi:hypothetical protein
MALCSCHFAGWQGTYLGAGNRPRTYAFLRSHEKQTDPYDERDARYSASHCWLMQPRSAWRLFSLDPRIPTRRTTRSAVMNRPVTSIG